VFRTGSIGGAVNPEKAGSGLFPAIDPGRVPWLSVEQMREVDRIMVGELRITLVRMMENAGRSLAQVARDLLGGDTAGRAVVVLAGPGGNGGGLVAARHLAVAGAEVSVAVSAPAKRFAPVSAEQLAMASICAEVQSRSSARAASPATGAAIGPSCTDRGDGGEHPNSRCRPARLDEMTGSPRTPSPDPAAAVAVPRLERVRAWIGPALETCCAPATLRRTTRIAAVVGVVLSGINEGGSLAHGNVSVATGVKMALNFVVPFVVSNLGVLAGTRRG